MRPVIGYKKMDSINSPRVNKNKKKIITRDESAKLANEMKKNGRKIVTINGSFDILHAGHARMLEEAKQQGNILFVGLNSDKSVQAWKRHIGNKDWKVRPIVPEKYRAEMLASLKCVDYVIIYDEKDPINFIKAIRPDVHVNGKDYGKDCIERKMVEKYGGKIYIAKFVDGFSTSKLVAKILEAHRKSR